MPELYYLPQDQTIEEVHNTSLFVPLNISDGLSRRISWVTKRQRSFRSYIEKFTGRLGEKSRGKKSKIRVGSREAVAKILWHVPIFTEVSADVTRDSPTSRRSSLENTPRLNSPSSPAEPSPRIYPSICFASCISFHGDQTLATRPRSRKIGSRESRFAAIVLGTRLPLCRSMEIKILFPP